MEMISVAVAKAHLSGLLDRVEKGDEVVITRRGKPVARLTTVNPPKKPVQPLTSFRAQISPLKVPGSAALRLLREEER